MTALRTFTKSITPILSGGALFALAALVSCTGPAASDADNPDVLARLGKASLSLSDVRKNMPGGLSDEDSARFVRAYVNTWVDEHLIADVASGEVDMTEIDRMVDDYRRRLIMSEYTRRMFRAHAATISDDSIKAYYEKYKGEFVLERPMVKGTYLKVPDDARNLRALRRLYRSDKPEDADKLEKEVLSGVIHYDYFRNRWVDWEQIETRIPYDFGATGDGWLASHRNLDISSGGFTYLLYITDVLPAGSPMPPEAAREQITTRMLNSDRKAYELKLLLDLREAAEADGRLYIKNND